MPIEYTVLAYWVGPRAAAATSVKFKTEEAAHKAEKFFRKVPADRHYTLIIKEETGVVR